MTAYQPLWLPNIPFWLFFVVCCYCFSFIIGHCASKLENWTELNWPELGWTELDWTELKWTRVNWNGLDWTALNWTDLNRTALNSTIIAMSHHYNGSLYIVVKARSLCEWLSLSSGKRGWVLSWTSAVIMRKCSAVCSLQLRVFLLLHVFSDLCFTLPFYS